MDARKIVSIDPGRQVLGVASWRGGLLERVTLSRVECNPAMAGSVQLAGLCESHARGLSHYGAEVAIVEGMRHYPATTRRETAQERDAKANDLLDLQAIGLYLAAKLAQSVVIYAASEWKGQADKVVTTNRVVRELQVSELEVLHGALTVSPQRLQHNLYDAIGLGLKFLGRFHTGRA